MVETQSVARELKFEKLVVFDTQDVVVAGQMVSEGCPNRGVDVQVGTFVNKEVMNGSQSILEQENHFRA